jgi:Cu+-exporting ATPase
MLILSIPVVIFSAKDYFITAFKGLRKGIASVDVPIALGIIVLFLRSAYETFTVDGEVFFDSLTGLVFFLLLGKFFQQKTYNFLSFERDYRSYFPIAVTKIVNQKEENIPVQSVKVGDRILIRNEELIPVDGILIHGEGILDYSFVTGESAVVYKENGDKIYAGGKQVGSAIEIDVINKISESYLTELWSNDVFGKDHFERDLKSTTNSISKYFTIIILLIAFISAVYWIFNDSSKVIEVVTAVLIIACPCALALSAPFALGNMLRIFGYRKFYLKNASVIERINKIDHIIFDKTGTITTNDTNKLSYEGTPLSVNELKMIKTLIRSSNHPLSRALNDVINVEILMVKIENYEEFLGKGISGTINGKQLKIGSSNFVDAKATNDLNTLIYIKIDNEIKGFYKSKNVYRKEVENVFIELSKKYKISILSGDNEGEKTYLERIIPKGTKLLFFQKPQDKLNYIKNLQDNGKHVMMIGDGLNDAGALAQSHVGIAISENVNVFSPACDAIMEAKLFNKLPKFLTLSQKTINIIKWSFKISFMYNIVGLYFAVTAQLTPIIAAILMPLSSISIVIFVTILTNYAAKE